MCYYKCEESSNGECKWLKAYRLETKLREQSFLYLFRYLVGFCCSFRDIAQYYYDHGSDWK